MKMQLQRTDTGSTLICALCTIVIVSLIGANVLINCASRYNVSAKQLKGWKEALYAAEGGGDIGFAQVRKKWNDWNDDSSFSSWSNETSPDTFGQANSLSTSVTVDKLVYTDPVAGDIKYY